MAAAKKPRPPKWKKVGELQFGEGASGPVMKVVTPINTYYLHACDFTKLMKKNAFTVEEPKQNNQRKPG